MGLATVQAAKPGRKGEAIPSRPEGDLAQCAEKIREVVRKTLRGYIYIGVLCMQAKLAYGRREGRPKKNSDTVSEFPSFEAWLNAQDLGFSAKSAERYIAAAEALGLEKDSTEKDVEKLDLDGLTLKALTAPVSKPGPPLPPSAPTPDPVDVAASYWQPMLELTWEVGQADSEHHKALMMMPLVKLQELAGQMEDAAKLVKSTLKARLK